MPGNKAFGDFVRKLREEKKQRDPTFSLRRFAMALDVSPTFLSRMETGEFDPPAPEKIVKMADLLGVDRDELLRLAGKTDPEFAAIVREPPRGLAVFLRTARREQFTDEEYQKALSAILEQRQREK